MFQKCQGSWDDTSLIPSEDTEDPQILDAIVKTLVTPTTWRLTFARPWFVVAASIVCPSTLRCYSTHVFPTTHSDMYTCTYASSGTILWINVWVLRYSSTHLFLRHCLDVNDRHAPFALTSSRAHSIHWVGPRTVSFAVERSRDSCLCRESKLDYGDIKLEVSGLPCCLYNNIL